jgi:PAS domain S-box-containing protein
VLSFAVLPFVMWAAIDFGIGGASLSVLLIATSATLLTALGHGPFSTSTPFVNAALLDVLFTVLAVSGLALAAAIAERERAETERERLIRAQAAMETRLHLAAIVESSNDAILSMTMHGVILSWNAAAQRIFGFTEAEAIGQPAAILIPSGPWDEHVKMLKSVRAGDPIDSFETIGVTKTGRTLNVSATVSPLRDARGRVFGAAAIVRDTTESKRAEQALSTVSRRLIDAQEQERSRIARELHDDIGQRLSLLAVNLTGLAKDGLSSPRLHTQTLELQRQAAGVAADVQALSHQLHSSRLSLLGLEAAMRQFCEEFADQQRVRIEFESRDLPDRLPPDTALCLFRILQESLHNAAKHSGVRTFEVQLRGTDGRVHLAVRDHGKGFDACTARTGGGIGLISMEERMKLVGGDLYIESQPQGGTTIYARVPFGPPPAATPAAAAGEA